MSTVKGYIHSTWCRYSKTWTYNVYPWDMTNQGYVLLEIRDIEFESPSDLMLKHQLARVLKEEQKRVQAEAQVKLNDLSAQIEELLALEDLSGKEEA